MKNLVNHLTTLPDLLAMQRISFCWFITKGLTQEFALFSRIHHFNNNIEYFLFGEEYKLKKISTNLIKTRKRGLSFIAQVTLPMEARNREVNIIKHINEFSLFTFPLMTYDGSFLINGCERIIISQIVRSPGIYFGKNRRQLHKNQFKTERISENNLFSPTGEVSIKKIGLFFPLNSSCEKIKETEFGCYYSLLQLQKINKISSVLFLDCFKLFRTIYKINESQSKKTLIKLFLSWLKLKTLNCFSETVAIKNSIHFLVKQFNLLLKYLSRKKVINLWTISDDLIFNIQTLLTFKHNSQHILINTSKNFFTISNYFKEITTKLKINYSYKKLKEKHSLILFSNDLKNNLKTIFGKNFCLGNNKKFFENTIKYKDKTLIGGKKYENLEPCFAIIIPEHGTWIRFDLKKKLKFDFQGNLVKAKDYEIVIRLDPIYEKHIITLLEEMGITKFEIINNYKHSDFFYLNSAMIIDSKIFNKINANIYLNYSFRDDISEFSKIFDPAFYKIGKICRSSLNNRLNIKLDNNLQNLCYTDIYAITDKLIDFSLSKLDSDDIDHLKYRRVRFGGELLKNVVNVGFKRFLRNLNTEQDSDDFKEIFNFNILTSTVREFFGSSELSQYLDQTNPLSSLTHKRRISCLGVGGFDRDRISFAVRDIHPSHYGRICPIETPEGKNVGLVSSLTAYAKVNSFGFLETPFWRVINGKVIKNGSPIYLSADVEDFYKIAPADIKTNEKNYLLKNLIPVRYKQDFISVSSYDVDFIAISPTQIVSVAASLIPFFEHDDANRSLMGSNMQRQSVPLILPQKPIVGTGLENQIVIDSGHALSTYFNGKIDSVDSTKIVLICESGKKIIYKLNKYLRSNQKTCINQRPIVWPGETVKTGDVITDGPSISGNELSLGQNILISYMPWNGYNFEDSVLISERLVYENIFTSIHIKKYQIKVDKINCEYTTKNIPALDTNKTINLTETGIVEVGTFLEPGDLLVGKVVPSLITDESPEISLLKDIFEINPKKVINNSYLMPQGEYGRVLETLIVKRREDMFDKVIIFVAQIKKIEVGDKIAGRHGNKGIISRILPRQDMPFLPDGTPIDIILNPLGIPSRMNVGQLYECLLGLAGDKLNTRFKILPFDEMHGSEASRILINKKLRQASIVKNESWLFNPNSTGKILLIDGRTGEKFENPVTVGNAYMLKLIHLVDDKIHARSTGPYSLITQQPLQGKSKNGGQRFGEMEIWALEGFGAAFTLKELLTLKSDDIQNRKGIVSSITKNKSINLTVVSESLKVLLNELRSIGLDIGAYNLEQFSSNNKYEAELNVIESYSLYT